MLKANINRGFLVGDEKLPWVKKNTAILVIHGIGNQLPFETLDQFGRGIIKQYKNEITPGDFNHYYDISHRLTPKEAHNGGTWFDNVVRITKLRDLSGATIADPVYLDIYEYYWADYTEDKADTSDINKWLNGIVKGSGSFYSTAKNAELGKQYHDKSPLFKENGTLLVGRYKTLLFLVRYILPICQFFIRLFLKLFSNIPIVGNSLQPVLKDFITQKENDFNNVIGDIAIYNVTDPKCKNYVVRRNILDGAVNALKYLIESQAADESKPNTHLYENVFVAGHSLGSEIAYDAVNKINLLVNEGNIKGYSSDGNYSKRLTGKKHNNISDQLCGLATFGSPLDKIAFFLREVIPDKEYLRQQIIDHYHGFKQRDWTGINKNKDFVKIGGSLHGILTK